MVPLWVSVVSMQPHKREVAYDIKSDLNMLTDSINLERANLICFLFIFAELPPRPLLERLAKELRRQLVAIIVSPFCFAADNKLLLPDYLDIFITVC